MTEPAPIIVTATLAPADFAWADGLRRTHFPPERNLLDAHLTMFHHLAPGLRDELATRLTEACRTAPPPAMVDRLLNLGRGVALGIRSEGLVAIRRDLADAFADMLTPQDRAGWRPHITIQNKATPAEAKALLATLSASFAPRPLHLSGLAMHFYRGGPWETIRRFAFRGQAATG